MSTVNQYQSYYDYVNEYSNWRDERNSYVAKRQEYFRRNPEALRDYDIQRTKIFLNTVDMMDKSIVRNSDNNIDTAFESFVNLGLGYAAVGGTTLGYLLTKLKVVKTQIDKIIKNNKKSRNMLTMGIAASTGVLGILAVYPLYNYLTKVESKIYRKRRFDTMEKELNDPRIFAVLDSKQKKVFKENLEKIDVSKNYNKTTSKSFIKNLKKIATETLNYEENQAKFKEKYSKDTTYYDKELSAKDIKNAKKDRELLIRMIQTINTKSQSYTEKMERITDNIVTLSFALGSLFALGYERLAKTLKFKSSSLPAGTGVVMLVASTFFASWAQRRASLVGRFKAKQELMEQPEHLVYLSSKYTSTINEDDIVTEKSVPQKTNMFKFLKDFFKHNKEYNEWLRTPDYRGKDIVKAMEGIELSPEQIKDGKRLQENMFKTFYKVDKNTQNYSGKLEVIAQSIKYPLTLILGTIGSLWGVKHLAKLRNSVLPKDVVNNTLKYIATISLFMIPSFIANSYFAKAQKMGARVSDMMTMKDLEDYRFFADYSKYAK